MQSELATSVNGEVIPYPNDHEARMSLADFLRETVGLRSVRVACEQGICGVCTVLVDGHAAKSCTVLALQAAGCEVTTIEGIGQDDELLLKLRTAFREHHALQCGYCTPGMLLSALYWLREAVSDAEDEAREAISGNLCRCTGYQPIVEAMQEVARSTLIQDDDDGE